MRPWLWAHLAALAIGAIGGALVRAIPLNQALILGSHNSFHLRPDEQITGAVDRLIDSGLVPDEVMDDENLFTLIKSVRYDHPPIPEQLQHKNIRAIELDVWPDPNGGRFRCNPIAQIFRLRKYADEDPVMAAPGFKVFHADNIDQETTCKTLATCLAVLKRWADANPAHFPIIIRMDVKRDTMIDEVESRVPRAASALDWALGFARGRNDCPDEWPRTEPPVTSETLRQILDEYVTTLGRDKLITPDDLRGNYSSLRDALRRMGAEHFWPDVETIRGKFLIVTGGVNSQLRGAYGSKLKGSPAFARLFVDKNTPADVWMGSDTVFAEHHVQPLNPIIATLKQEGLFLVARVDNPLLSTSERFQLYRDAIAAGVNVLVSDFIVPQDDDTTAYSVKLPCGRRESCDLANRPVWRSQMREDSVHEIQEAMQGWRWRVLQWWRSGQDL